MADGRHAAHDRSRSGLRGFVLCIYFGFICKSLGSIVNCLSALRANGDAVAALSQGGLFALLGFELINLSTKLSLIWHFNQIGAARLRDWNLLIVSLEVGK